MSNASLNDNVRGQAGEVGTAQNSQLALCFSDARVVNPAYPSSKHLPGRVLAMLLQGRHVTHLDALRELGHARLADSVWKLRGLGWSIETIEETVATSDAGRPATIGIYFLSPGAIDEAGERGRAFADECARLAQERRAP